MPRVMGCWLLLSLAACSNQSLGEQYLFGVVIGKAAPVELLKGKTEVGPYTFITLPVSLKSLQSVLPEVNVFVLSSSYVVAGLRGDRRFSDMPACNEAKALVADELNRAYGNEYKGPDPRYQFQSKDGRVLAGVLCAASTSEHFPRLMLEVTDPQLEEVLNQAARENHK